MTSQALNNSTSKSTKKTRTNKIEYKKQLHNSLKTNNLEIKSFDWSMII